MIAYDLWYQGSRRPFAYPLWIDQYLGGLMYGHALVYEPPDATLTTVLGPPCGEDGAEFVVTLTT